MAAGSTISTIASGIVTLVALIVSGVIFFMSLVLALNGYMGQERAINGSFISYFILAALVLLIFTAISAGLAYYLSAKRQWNAALAALLSIVLTSGIGVALHLVCVVIAAIVAESLRTGK